MPTCIGHEVAAVPSPHLVILSPLAEFVERLAREKVIRDHQAKEIVQRACEPPDERWASPFLRDVREHTRAFVDAMCPGPLGRPTNPNTAEEGIQ